MPKLPNAHPVPQGLQTLWLLQRQTSKESQDCQMKTASDPRHKERQKTVKEIFAWEANKTHPLSEKSISVTKNLARIDSFIKESAPEWELDRINKIDLAILRLGVYELTIDPVAPAKVIIDEAVELAKEFGNETSPGFINGALGKVLKSKSRLMQLISSILGVDFEELSDNSDLKNDLGATPVEISDLFTRVEKDYNIVIPKDNLPATVGDLALLIEDETV